MTRLAEPKLSGMTAALVQKLRANGWRFEFRRGELELRVHCIATLGDMSFAGAGLIDLDDPTFDRAAWDALDVVLCKIKEAHK